MIDNTVIPMMNRFDLLMFMRGVGLEVTNGDKARAESRKVGPFQNLQGDYLTETICNLNLSDQPEMRGLDYIFSDTLHFADDPVELAGQYWDRIAEGGWLILAVPDPEYSPKPGHFGAPPEWKAHPDIDAILKFEGSEEATMFVGQFRRGPFVWELWAIGKNPKYVPRIPRPGEIVVVRLGAFGDHLWSSSLFPALKLKKNPHQGGWSPLIYMTNDKGYEVTLHDPNVEGTVVWTEGQLKPEMMWDFMDWVNVRWPEAVHLNYEAETRLLFPPACVSHKHPDSVRRQLAAGNYVEWLGFIAGVEPGPVLFHASEDERQWAQGLLEPLGPGPIFGIVIHGSSVNKFWPHMPALVVRLMHKIPEARFVIFGEGAGAKDAADHLFTSVGRFVEAGAEDRFLNMVDRTNIREAMSLANECDVVIAPETALLNAVSYNEQVFKVALLSHSTVENLTKGWPNTASFAARGLGCYPCHRIHFDWTWCNKSPDGAWAMCQELISPDAVEGVILAHLGAQEG